MHERIFVYLEVVVGAYKSYTQYSRTLYEKHCLIHTARERERESTREIYNLQKSTTQQHLMKAHTLYKHAVGVNALPLSVCVLTNNVVCRLLLHINTGPAQFFKPQQREHNKPKRGLRTQTQSGLFTRQLRKIITKLPHKQKK